MKIAFLAAVMLGEAALSPLLGEGSDRSVAAPMEVSPKVLSSDGETLPDDILAALTDPDVVKTAYNEDGSESLFYKDVAGVRVRFREGGSYGDMYINDFPLGDVDVYGRIHVDEVIAGKHRCLK